MSVPSGPSGPAGHRPDHGVIQSGSVHGNLPAVYAHDPTAQAFATAIDSMLIPVDRTLDRLPDNFDAFAAPAELLPYLVRVSQARVEPSWPERAVRAAIDLAAWLAVHRGTPAALLREASVVYGWTLTVADPGGVRLPDDATAWPADGTLYVDLEPVLSGWDPVPYSQGSLERLIAAHVPASAPRILAPPPGKCALYEGPYSTGFALVVHRDIANLATSGFDNRTSSVWNRSRGILGLYEDPDYGDNGSHQFVGAQQAVNVMESLNKLASSVKYLTTVPAGSWGLLDADGNLIGLYDGDMGDLGAGVGASATSLVNNTIHTLEAFATQPGPSQVVYPGVTAALDAGLAGALNQVTVYTQVPDGAFCLYELPQQGGKQWVLWTSPGGSADLAPIGANDAVSSVYNRTAVTLQLWANSDRTGATQFFYPSAFADVTASGLAGQASLVVVHNGAPAGHFCLYGGLGRTGKQWVFSDAAGSVNLTDPRIAAGDAVSTVQNLTTRTLELFRTDNVSGVSQLFYPGLTVDVTTTGLALLAKSVATYNGPPPGYYCLYANTNKAGNQWVFRDTATTVNLTDPTIGAGSAASLVENNTTRTLELFKNNDGTGDSQLFYPGATTPVTAPGLDNQAKSATMYYATPSGYYCLYGGSPVKQWVFKATAGSEQNLVTAGSATIATGVHNNSDYTIELFAETNGSGAYQLCYPKTDVSIAADLLQRAKLVRCYNGPPANYFCLYDGTNQTGTQWVFRAAPGTWWDANAPGQNWNDKVSSVRNLTRHTIQLFEAAGQGMRGELFWPGQNQNVTTINNLASSVACYNGCPPGYICLFDGANQSGNQFVLRPTIGITDLAMAGASNKISAVRNLTDYTFTLNAPAAVQYCYPSQNANVQDTVNNKATSITVYNGPPAGCYCLYANTNKSGHQWIFADTATTVNLTSAGIGAGNAVSLVDNATTRTLALFRNTDGTGTSQFFYPGATAQVTVSGLDKQAQSATMFNGAPAGYYCLSGGSPLKQWVFPATPGSDQNLATAGAASTATQVQNNSIYTIELFAETNGSGANQMSYPGTDVALQTSLRNLAKLGKCYNGPPNGYFCLYDGANQTGAQWVFRDAPGTSWNANAPGQNWNDKISSVRNLTTHTIQLFEHGPTDGRGELFWPGQNQNVGAINNQASSMTCYDGPPSGYYCLYTGANQTGNQFVLRGDIGNVDLRNVGCNDMASSVRNLTSYSIQLWADPGPSGIWQMSYPAQNANIQASLDNKTTIVQVHNGPPAGYYCLYANANKSGNQWVFGDAATTVNLTSAGIGAGNAVSLVNNNTTRTLALFKNNNGTGTNQFFYPGATASVTVSGLDKQAQSATVYDRAPAGYYCLYGGSPQRQWVFPATPGSEQNLAAAGAANTAIQVQNNSTYTIELFQETNGTGAYQLSYPSTDVAVQTNLRNLAKLVKCYNGPPNNYFCLYQGTNQTGTQWVYRATPGTSFQGYPPAAENWNDIVSSVRNLSQYTIQLFEGAVGAGRTELFWPGQNQNVTTLQGLASSGTCLNGPPNGYYCLYTGVSQSGSQFVLPGNIGNVDLRNIGCNDMISSVRNMTDYTIQLWADPGPSGIWQMCYPSLNTNVQANLDNKTTIVQVHNGPPPGWSGYYCLYEHGPGSGKQWLFHESSTAVDLTASNINAYGISNVANNTWYTLQLWSNANASGSQQMFYPGLLTSATGGFNDLAKSARLLRVDPANRSSLYPGYFCLFEHGDYGGIQWVFPGYCKVNLVPINAAGQVSSVANNTGGAVWLYSNDNWTGTTYIVNANVWTNWVGNFNDRARSVWE